MNLPVPHFTITVHPLALCVLLRPFPGLRRRMLGRWGERTVSVIEDHRGLVVRVVVRVESALSSSSIVSGGPGLAVAPLLTGARSFTGQSGAVVMDS